MATLSENVSQAIHDFDEIKDAIEYKGVEVPEGTATSEYSEKIKEIQTGITPTGTIEITENGNYDVTAYAEANVDVPQPSGTISIQTNGTFNIANYANANVYVPESIYMIERQLPADQYGQRSMTVTAESVGDSAFRNFDELQFAYLDNSVTEIGPNAFSDCTSLVYATLGSAETIGDSAFENCSKLETMTIPNSVTNIGYRSFANCDSITSLTIGLGIESIGADAFKMEGPYNSKNSNIHIMNLSSWLNIDFENLYANPIWLKNHHGGAVYIEGELVNQSYTLHIPEGIIEIKDFAFYSFEMTQIDFPSTLETVGELAFGGCRYLSTVVIPEGVRRIESGAFSDLSKIESISIPSTVEYIADDAFSLRYDWSSSSHSLSITVDANNTYYDNRDGCLVRTATNKLLLAPPGLNSIPSSVEIVGAHAFPKFSGSLVIPQSVYEIEDGAFAGTDITSVDIPNTCRYVGKEAFSDCKFLADISVAATYIDSSAFYGCSAENSIIVSSDVKYVGEDSFNSLSHYPQTCTFTSKYDILEPGSISIIGNKTFNAPESITFMKKGSIVCLNRREYSCNVNIGPNATYIEPGFLSIGTLLNAHKIEVNITVDPANSNYCSIYGSLYSIDKKRCLHVHGATWKSIIRLPQEVEVLEPFAFNNTLAEVIYLSNNCKILKTNSIINKPSLYIALYIYSNLEIIEPYAVDIIANHCTIYYQGTEENWKKIHIGEGNESLTNATIHYQASW